MTPSEAPPKTQPASRDKMKHPPNLLIPQNLPTLDSINLALNSPVLPGHPPALGALQLDIESDDEEEDDLNQLSIQDHSSHYKQFGDIENEEILYSGYLLKKGERRKTWKRRWFVLRKTCLVYYKNEKEYRLLRIIPLNDIHTCAEVQIKQYDNTFGIVTTARTYYVRARSRSERNQWTNKVTMAKLSLKSLENQHPSVRKPASTPTTPSAITITDQPKYPLALPPTPISSPNQATINPISIVQPGEPSSSSSAISWASDSFHLYHSSGVRPSDNTATITKASLKRDMSLSAHPLDTLESPVSYHPTNNSFAAHNMSSTGSSTGNQPQSSEKSFMLHQTSFLHHHQAVPAVMSSSEEDNEQEELPTPPVRLATSAPKSTYQNQTTAPETLPLQYPAQERKVSLPEAGKTIIQGYLMKQGKRKNWRKRYFVLTSQKLVYSRTHMDVGGRNTRQIPIGRLLDAIEHDQVESPATVSTTLTTGGGIGFHHQGGGGGGGGQSTGSSVGGNQEDHYFKIITSERTYLLNAPTEEDEIRWISAIRCLLKSYRANLPRSFDGILDHPIDSNLNNSDRLTT